MTGAVILGIVYGALVAFMVDAWMQERRNDD
jgi:hypothetical protein